MDAPALEPGELVGATRAATILGVSKSRLNVWARNGLIDFVRTQGGHRRYRTSDLWAALGWAAIEQRLGPAINMPLAQELRRQLEAPS